MIDNFAANDKFIEDNLLNNINELSQLCKFQSVSAKNLQLPETAAFLSELFIKRGFNVKIFSDSGGPVVYAERMGRIDKTLLFYNHYDVQPAEPLELWNTDPFDLVKKDGKLFARGVSDDKGQIISRLSAIDSLLQENELLPCNIKFVIEGEEEVSSKNLKPFVEQNKDLLKSDACVWEFGGVDDFDQPILYLGLRGICYVELSVTTANQDVHSGLGGSIFPNAAWRLIWALNSLKDQDENILIHDFYNDVVPPSEMDIALFKQIPNMGDIYKKRYEIKQFTKGLQDGVDLNVAEAFSPTCTICGVTSGYQGIGSKTVLPAKASAKIDFRLVPDQTPERVLILLRDHLDKQGFEDVEITFLGGEAPARTDPADPFVELVAESATSVYGMPMMIVPMVGGSGPNHLFIENLNVPVVTAGVSYPGSQNHAPNENIRINDFINGTRHMVRIIKNFGNL
ncbi:MAG: M20/M25/M40 family metallo-hydrolase [Anaerolineaceae bacterium]|nr:M20/M25/M40 family metallo-hydrolase [Anaerolineaceae bacterium]